MPTPLSLAPKLAEALGLKTELFLKREDQHPFGSHKGRSIPKMIEKYAAEGQRDFVISSSGNAALAAAMEINEYNEKNKEKISLKIFVGENIPKDKMEMINGVIARSLPAGKAGTATKQFQWDRHAPSGLAMTLIQTANPKQSAFLEEKNKQAKNLRQSTDDSALIGYEDLAKELAEIKNLAAVFVPTSSGTTAQGLWLGFKKFGLDPQIHIVQTTACHPMVEEKKLDSLRQLADRGNDKKNEDDSRSLADAIVDKVAHRKEKVLAALNESNGAGWVASDEEIKTAIALAEKTEGVKISANSALSLVGLKKALEQGRRFNGATVCLITGQ